MNRSPNRQRSPCSNPLDYISQEKFYDEIKADDILYLHLGSDNIECFDIDSLFQYFNHTAPMADWVQNPLSRNLMDDMGRGGLPGQKRFMKFPLGYPYIYLTDIPRLASLLNTGFRHFKGTPLETVRMGNIHGSFGVSELHGQLPAQTVFSLEEMYDKRRSRSGSRQRRSRSGSRQRSRRSSSPQRSRRSRSPHRQVANYNPESVGDADAIEEAQPWMWDENDPTFADHPIQGNQLRDPTAQELALAEEQEYLETRRIRDEEIRRELEREWERAREEDDRRRFHETIREYEEQRLHLKHDAISVYPENVDLYGLNIPIPLPVVPRPLDSDHYEIYLRGNRRIRPEFMLLVEIKRDISYMEWWNMVETNEGVSEEDRAGRLEIRIDQEETYIRQIIAMVEQTMLNYPHYEYITRPFFNYLKGIMIFLRELRRVPDLEGKIIMINNQLENLNNFIIHQRSSRSSSPQRRSRSSSRQRSRRSRSPQRSRRSRSPHRQVANYNPESVGDAFNDEVPDSPTVWEPEVAVEEVPQFVVDLRQDRQTESARLLLNLINVYTREADRHTMGDWIPRLVYDIKSSLLTNLQDYDNGPTDLAATKLWAEEEMRNLETIFNVLNSMYSHMNRRRGVVDMHKFLNYINSYVRFLQQLEHVTKEKMIAELTRLAHAMPFQVDLTGHSTLGNGESPTQQTYAEHRERHREQLERRHELYQQYQQYQENNNIGLFLRDGVPTGIAQSIFDSLSDYAEWIIHDVPPRYRGRATREWVNEEETNLLPLISMLNAPRRNKKRIKTLLNRLDSYRKFLFKLSEGRINIEQLRNQMTDLENWV
jgi:hypothetical protein